MAFKKFQRLPEVATIKLIAPRWNTDEIDNTKNEMPRSQRNFNQPEIRIL